MKSLKVYERVNKIRKYCNVVSSKWVFRYKYNSDKRLVARSFTKNKV